MILVCVDVGKESKRKLKNGLNRAGFGAQAAMGFALAALECLRMLFPHCCSLFLVTTDLKSVSFPCDSFSWQAAKYLSSCVRAWLQFWLNFTLLEYPFTTRITGGLSRGCVINWSVLFSSIIISETKSLEAFWYTKNLVKANYYSY